MNKLSDKALRAYFAGFKASVVQLAQWLGPPMKIPATIPRDFTVGDLPPNVRVLFLHSRHPSTKFHLVLLFTLRGAHWFVDPGRALVILPCIAGTQDRLERMLKPRYTVRLHRQFSSSGAVELVSDPYSCVTMVRSLLAIDEPSIQLPEQLLNYFWEKRYGRRG